MKTIKIRFKSFGRLSRPYDYLLIGSAKSGGHAKLRVGAGKYDYKEIVVCGVEDVGADLPTHVTKALRFVEPGVASVGSIPEKAEKAKRERAVKKEEGPERMICGRKWSSLTPAQQKVWGIRNPDALMKRHLTLEEIIEGRL